MATQAAIIDLGVVEDPDSLADRQPGGYLLFVGEAGGKSYLLDTHMALSTSPDLVAFLAADSGYVVVGYGAETVSGSYWFIAARGGTLLRHYHSADAGPALRTPSSRSTGGCRFPPSPHTR